MRVGSSSSSPSVRPSSGDLAVQAPAGGVEQHVPDERVAVGVQPRRLHGQHHVPGPHPARTQQPIGLDHAGRGAGDVVLVGFEQTRVLRRLAADQRAAGQQAGLGDALHDRRDPLRYDAAGGDVVGHEQRLSAADHEVVDHHADQVEPDGVVHVHRLGDGHLGADAVGGGGQQGSSVAGQRGGVEQAGEAAQPADHLRATGLLHPDLHQLDRGVGRLDGDAGGGVRVLGLGHRHAPAVTGCSGRAAPCPGSARTATPRAGVCPAGSRRAARWGTGR